VGAEKKPKRVAKAALKMPSEAAAATTKSFAVSQ
jgi:hypothetical protein